MSLPRRFNATLTMKFRFDHETPYIVQIDSLVRSSIPVIAESDEDAEEKARDYLLASEFTDIGSYLIVSSEVIDIKEIDDPKEIGNNKHE